MLRWLVQSKFHPRWCHLFTSEGEREWGWQWEALSSSLISGSISSDRFQGLGKAAGLERNRLTCYITPPLLLKLMKFSAFVVQLWLTTHHVTTVRIAVDFPAVPGVSPISLLCLHKRSWQGLEYFSRRRMTNPIQNELRGVPPSSE